ncbi:transketolase-like TK C-terminal-containing protein [Dietzia cercidiphylli]|uniref:transketolase-like TK C-terminal-containing protein n=1 Tax=Dietzia cercidiphylli TaxID=498199 RepID=UPI00223B9BBB|nr:pyruvate dehydrogenase [Dietzia cercidiphylli]MCT1515090.1 pyruvate dehydrogenase [Dietzia cercidiphylli]
MTHAATEAATEAAAPGADSATLESIAKRVLWTSTAMIHHANRVRPNPSGLKVGGHQASCASMVHIMTSLWFGQLRPGDRVSVKPHASPVLHSINYLLGDLDEKYMPTLREYGGLQPYPSRSKDPDRVDYSTGSVGIGATAPLWGAMARRYVDTTFGPTGPGRQYSLVGDAELDEGAVWEAVLDPSVAELGEVVWIVDMNRQSLDRVVPNIAAPRLEQMFAAAGWQVLTVDFGRTLEELFARPGGDALRRRLRDMSNPEYQRLLRCSAQEIRDRLPGEGADAEAIATVIGDLADAALLGAISNLGGHDIDALRDAYARIDDQRPTVILAYTVKGFGLPTQGHPQNHSSLLTGDQFASLADSLGEEVDRPWRRFDPSSPEGTLCAATAQYLRREPAPSLPDLTVPRDLSRTPPSTSTTQAALGRVLLDLTRDAPDVAARVVTVSPDVSSTTNLAGWLNKVGVWSPTERHDWFADDSETVVKWRERPTGQHMELGIAETNLVGLLGELGATWSRWGQPLLPIGVVYDPFVERALEPWSFGIYSGGQSILVGTPSGVSLSAEGGAHQSVTTPSVGLEQPGCVAYEPAFALEVQWILLDCLAHLGRPDGRSAYLRLSTRPVVQDLALVPDDPAARERRRAQVVAGAYTLRPCAAPDATIVAMGAVVSEALAAADRLSALNIRTEVVCVTSAGLMFAAIQARAGRADSPTWILDAVFPANRAAPMVTVLDGHPHTLAFLATINNVPIRALGVSTFGQTGALDDVYRHHGIDADSIVRAALDAVS